MNGILKTSAALVVLLLAALALLLLGNVIDAALAQEAAVKGLLAIAVMCGASVAVAALMKNDKTE